MPDIRHEYLAYRHAAKDCAASFTDWSYFQGLDVERMVRVIPDWREEYAYLADALDSYRAYERYVARVFDSYPREWLSYEDFLANGQDLPEPDLPMTFAQWSTQ